MRVEKYIDILDGSLLFNNIKGKNRISLFTDEIHLSSKGENLFAEAIFQALKIKAFNKSKNIFNQKNKIELNKNEYLKTRYHVGQNSTELNIDIRRFISKGFTKKKTRDLVVSTDVYTTS